jgi:thiol-disulfide isomerase/thioredoxin
MKKKIKFEVVNILVITKITLLLLIPLRVSSAIPIPVQKVAKHYIDIHLKYKEATPNDTLTLVIENVFYGDAGIESNNLGSCRAVAQSGVFNFHLSVYQKCGYFKIYTQRKITKRGWATNIMPLIKTCFWQSGDNVSISLSHKETAAGIYSRSSFSGHGSLKYNVAQLIDSIFSSTVVERPQNLFDSLANFKDFFPGKSKAALETLKRKKHLLDNFNYGVLKANILYASGNGRFNLISEYYDKNIREAPEATKKKFRQKVNSLFLKNDNPDIQKDILANSDSYTRYNYYKFKMLSYINTEKEDQRLIYNLIKQNLSGVIRDQACVFLFVNYFKTTSLTELYADAIKFVYDPVSKQTLNSLLKASPGRPFYNFCLQDLNNRNVAFTQFKGKVVVVDFWFYGCGGCAQLYQNVLKQAELKLNGDSSVVFISINSDINRQRWMQGINSGVYTSLSVINLNTNGMGTTHPVISYNKITMFPTLILIDKKGIINSYNSADLYHYDGFIKAINAIRL